MCIMVVVVAAMMVVVVVVMARSSDMSGSNNVFTNDHPTAREASASRAEGPGFKSSLRQDFFGVESYQ